jgi:hypothetical protein
LSEPRNGNGAVGDSAATARHKELHKLLGIETYAEFPTDTIESQMDRPPRPPEDNTDMAAWEKYERRRKKWKPVIAPEERVFATYMRYSWCWPICLPYAVLTDKRDEILRDRKGNELVLTQEHVSDILSLSKQRVANLVQDLLAVKRIRTEARAGGFAGSARIQAVFIEARPMLSDQERCDKSTLVTTGIEGPQLEAAVLRRFSNLINEIRGADDAMVTFPGAAGEPGTPMRICDARTLCWQRIFGHRTTYKNTWKKAKYSERKGYSDEAALVRILIDQTQSPPLLGDSGAAAASSAASSPLLLPSSPLKRRGSVRPATHGENGQDVAPVGERPGYGGYGYATDDEALPIAPILEAFRPLRGGITDSHARRLLKDCGGATPAEIADKTGECIAAVINQRTVKNPAGLVIHKLMEFFHAPASLEMWRRDREEQAAQEAAAARRAEERRLEVERELQEMPPDDPEAIRQEALERMERKLKGGAS